MIPYGHHHISSDDVEAVLAVLRSDWLTQGPAVPQFEQALAARCEARHVIACNSGTSALHIACLALGLGKADLLWTSPNTFVASANCARYCGADVDFVDIDPRTYNMSVESLQEKLEASARAGRLPKVVVPVAFAGQSCSMRAIRELGREYGFLILEDASHALGGHYLGQPVGSGAHADVTVLSFHPVKIITSAEGGAAVTSSEDLASRMRRLRTHGIVREPELMSETPHGPWYYEQIDLGFNYRMTDLHAALGSSQLKRLDSLVAERHRLADRYDRLLAGAALKTPYRDPDAHSAFHLYVVLLDSELAAARRRVFDRMRQAGVGVNVHYIPVHWQPYYRKLGFRRGQFPVAEDYYSRAITLPLFPGLTDAQQDTIVAMLKDALRAEGA